MQHRISIDNYIEDYTKITEGSCRDSLTGLLNHGFFLELLEKEVQSFNDQGGTLVLAICDIDAFGFFNVQYGAFESDRALKNISDILRGYLPDSGFASRFYGDQFAMLFVQSGLETVRQTLEGFRLQFAEKSQMKLTLSIGMTHAGDNDKVSREILIRQAYSALEDAKRRGKNRICCFDSLPRRESTDAMPNILIVDDDPLNLKLLESYLRPMGYDVCRAECGRDALLFMQKNEVDLVLLDVMMPFMDGFEVCRAIKENEATRLTPVILVTALDDMESRVKGIEAGADDFVSKPPNKMELMARMRSLIRMKRLNNNLVSVENVLFSMANAVEAKDVYTQGHVDRVSRMALDLGRKLGLGQGELEALKLGGALHDIGKLAIPDTVLNKPGPLTPAEKKLMESHPEIGYRICLPLLKTIGPALDVIRHHHEKLDGSGYPDGLRGNEISLLARIMAVADIYDALSTDRPYRDALSKQESLKILEKEAREGKLDRDVVACLLRLESGEMWEGLKEVG